MKGSYTKIPVPCPDVIKMHNQGTGGVDLVYQKAAAYHLDSKFSIRFYLRIFFQFDGCSLFQRFSRLQYDASKQLYPA